MIQFHIVQHQIRRTIYHEDKCYLKVAKSYITLDIFVKLKRQKITKFFIYIIKTKEIQGILGGREEEGKTLVLPYAAPIIIFLYLQFFQIREFTYSRAALV